MLLEYTDVRLEVQGHTDDVGNDGANLDLSQRRAEAVVRWFTTHGVDAARLRAAGYGESRPVAENASDAGRAENRRVEFQLVQESVEPLREEMPASEPAPEDPAPAVEPSPGSWE